jgi:hypothetical protein
MVLQISLDGTFELDGGAMSAATDLPLCERREEALDLIYSGSRGGSEVHVKARMTGQPATHGVGLVRAVVVHHQCFGRRIQIKTDDVSDFLDKQRIGGSLKVSVRCGCSPKACQMRTTAVCDKPLASAIRRLLQCVAPSGRS